MNFVIMIVIGALAGWGAGKLMHSPLPLLWNIILGIAGGVIGGWLVGGLVAGILPEPLLAHGVTALLGSCLLLFVGKLLKK